MKQIAELSSLASIIMIIFSLSTQFPRGEN